jgi:hypothetical protein
MTGVDADLATLRGYVAPEPRDGPVRAALARVEARFREAEAELSRLREVEESFKHLSSEYQFDMDRGDHLVYREEWERFDRWQRLRDTLEEVDFVGAEGFAADMVAAAQAEASRLREERDYDVWNERILRRAAEARCARLQQALEWIIDYVPAGFVSPMDDEDSMNYRAVAREALAGPDAPADSQEDSVPIVRDQFSADSQEDNT